MPDEQSSPAEAGATDGGGGAPPQQKVIEYRSPEVKGGRRSGFFTIYKKGQGYWTRMGTALGAALIAFLFAEFIYTQMASIPLRTQPTPEYIPKSICIAVAAAIMGIIAFFAWRAMNKPRNVDFLIATDSEMKKVNWTTRKELIGSTKVVIFFVILISAILFILDLLFGYFFQLIKVLEFGPFQ